MKDGTYTVRSGYPIKLQSANLNSQRIYENLWQVIWKRNMPPKMYNFIWRACKDILLTRLNLAKRQVVTDLSCPRWGEEEIRIADILFTWNHSSGIWLDSPLNLYINNYHPSSVTNCLLNLHNVLWASDFDVALVFCFFFFFSWRGSLTHHPLWAWER